MIKIGSVFTGIAGIELGLEWAGLGPVVWQVESNPYARAVLAQHYPHASRYDDVRTVGAANLVRVGLICGGFPCQDVSSVGARAGLQGARSGLWYEFERIVGELHPQWVVVENVASGAAYWVDAIVGGLGRMGYACIPIPLAASDVGAPHRRHRVFVVAHNPDAPDADDATQPAEPVHAAVAASPSAASALASDALQSGRAGDRAEAHRGESRLTPHIGWEPQCGVVPLVHGVSTRLVGRARREQIRLLGNAVVPQCAEVIGWVIRELAGKVDAA